MAKERNNGGSELRRKAEKLYQERTLKKQLSSQETGDLIHELQVHQIELEMQNEQLRKAQEELEKSRQEYADLFDNNPVGYFELDTKAVIEKVNLTAAKMLGLEKNRIEHQPFSAFLAAFSSEGFFKHLKDVREQKEVQVCVFELKIPKSLSIWVKLMTVPILDETGNVAHFRSAVVNITDLEKFAPR
jgi:PAS domain S-box-containing protein